ncbi:hypothetical protein [Clostridium grantii]|nr:hypothetical protein [Clostridium grantii]
MSLLNKIKVENEIAFTGGVARSVVLKKAIEEKIRKPIYTPVIV